MYKIEKTTLNFEEFDEIGEVINFSVWHHAGSWDESASLDVMKEHPELEKFTVGQVLSVGTALEEIWSTVYGPSRSLKKPCNDCGTISENEYCNDCIEIKRSCECEAYNDPFIDCVC